MCVCVKAKFIQRVYVRTSVKPEYELGQIYYIKWSRLLPSYIEELVMSTVRLQIMAHCSCNLGMAYVNFLSTTQGCLSSVKQLWRSVGEGSWWHTDLADFADAPHRARDVTDSIVTHSEALSNPSRCWIICGFIISSLLVVYIFINCRCMVAVC